MNQRITLRVCLTNKSILEINPRLSTSTRQLCESIRDSSFKSYNFNISTYMQQPCDTRMQTQDHSFNSHIFCPRSHWQHRKGEMNAGQVHKEDAETEMDYLNRARESGLQFSPCGWQIGRWSKATTKTRWALYSTLFIHPTEMEIDREIACYSPGGVGGDDDDDVLAVGPITINIPQGIV